MSAYRRPYKTSRNNQSLQLLVVAFLLLPSVGCAAFGLGRKEDEYDLAKRAIESYPDADGNFIRPEGRLADKQKNSPLPGPLKNLPLLGTKPVNQELAKQQYAQAEKLFQEAEGLEGEARSKAFVLAGKKFDEAGKNWISSYLHQDSIMMAAESYFFAEKYPTAEDRYAQLVKDYPRTKYSDFVDKRRMEIGQFWMEFDDPFYRLNFTDKRKPWNDTPKHGVRVLEKMRLDSPTGSLADDATMQLATNNFKREKWSEALVSFDELITSYPDSKHLYQAHILGIKSALLSYRGPEYSQESLTSAKKYFRNLRQFPEQTRKDKEEIDRMYTELANRLAERLYSNAVYRYNKGEARASRIQCETILMEHGNTAYAELAQELLAKLEGMPDEPTPYLSELTILFPDRDKTTPLRKELPSHIIEADKQDQIERTARALDSVRGTEESLFR